VGAGGEGAGVRETSGTGRGVAMAVGGGVIGGAVVVVVRMIGGGVVGVVGVAGERVEEDEDDGTDSYSAMAEIRPRAMMLACRWWGRAGGGGGTCMGRGASIDSGTTEVGVSMCVSSLVRWREFVGIGVKSGMEGLGSRASS